MDMKPGAPGQVEREGGARERHAGGEPRGRYLGFLALAALGVVYGDIGTSPLYALRESFHFYGLKPTPENVLGVLSLVFWSLVLVISLKYAGLVLRADNRGEGGILALTSLVTPVRASRRGGRWILVALGLFGTALLYGDGMITPVISVLGAVEGLKVATPFFEPYIIPIAIATLAGLFLVQSHGTAGVGRIFGPVTLVWFIMLSVLGVGWIVREPGVLLAVSPHHAVGFFLRNGVGAFLVLGSVFLVVTGGEALYADLGHFGRRPIRLAWFTVVLPSLLLNYFGQGALLIQHPEAVENPFFYMGPAWFIYPQVVIATLAAIIASQALISGAFSLTMQAVQLGYLPRVEIRHTSARAMGQIYIPSVNWVLLACCIGLVLGFRSSTGVAAAYGVAVTTTMVVTTLLMVVLMRERWGWGRLRVAAFAAVFLVVDLAFWGANIIKVPHGGWFPLVAGAAVFALITTWKAGRQLLGRRLAESTLPWDFFVKDMSLHPPHRVPGTAVFMYGNRDGTPPALLHSLKHYKVLHERVVLLAVETDEIPHVPPRARTTVEDLGHGFFRIVLHYGFMDEPDVPAALAVIRADGLDLSPLRTTYFLGRETLIPSRRKGLAPWREHLFAVMSRNARTATSFFSLPPNRVVELGAQIEL
ncbi:MAG TPA: potassium transporter Kup [Longimicrobium sp.]|jgi:KUP system potassium uptake protein